MYPSRFCGVLVTAVALAACGPKSSTTTPVPPLTGEGSADQPPAIPAVVEATAVDPTAGHDPSARSPLLDFMLEENQRWMTVLSKKEPDPAYYLAYQIQDRRSVSIETEGGALIDDSDLTMRFLDTEVRVGSPQLDNMRPLSDLRERQLNEPLERIGVVPFGTDELAIKNAIWLETDRRYREALLALGAIKLDKKIAADQESPPDFAHAEPETYIQKKAELEFDKARWIERAKSCSRRALKGVATRGTCRVDFDEITTYFVNSEGSQVQLSWTTAQLSVSVGVKADDGMQLSRTEQRFGRQPSDLPSDEEIDRMIETVTADLEALHAAPVADPYVGPAILEGRAAGVFFHEVFGHRIEGHRQKDDLSGQTFTKKVGKQIMPSWLTVYDDPTIKTINGVQLNGFYRFDNEGVQARRVSLVEQGEFKGFLLGRQPIEGFPHSNGHGRKQPGKFTVSRQGNLVVEASRTVPYAELEKALLAEIQAQKLPYGMVFTDISGGFTNTTRLGAQSFKVNPVMAYRIYPDGKRELVRGIDIAGTPLTALGNIKLASREVETFNGICGAESGWVPVSASAPSLLIEKLEIERGFQPVDRPPVLPSPSIQGGAR